MFIFSAAVVTVRMGFEDGVGGHEEAPMWNGSVAVVRAGATGREEARSDPCAPSEDLNV